MDELEEYKYPPHKPLAVSNKNRFCALTGRTLMLHRSGAVSGRPMATVRQQVQTVTGRTLRLISTHRTRPVVQKPLWNLTGLSQDARTCASSATSG
jgi:hypothetical protein